MIRLHERLSEFSYGYGITRETEGLLASIGLTSTPFLPSLLHEQEVAFDVASSKPGAISMMQFKLGEELRRFRRTHPTRHIPILTRPFWRFRVDLDEHQFRRLHEAEVSGAEVYYVAPRFSTWAEYEHVFHEGAVLEHSLLLKPAAILNGTGASNGKHRVVYDRWQRYVCSDPVIIEETSPKALAENITRRTRPDERPLSEAVKHLAISEEGTQPTTRLSSLQRTAIHNRARTPVEGDAAIIGLEAWLQGAQVIFVTAISE